MKRLFSIMLLLIFSMLLFSCGGPPENIFEAVKRGDKNAVEKFIKDKPECINSRDSAGMTPLHHAAKLGKTNIAKLLIEKGAKKNAKDNDGFTPLRVAKFKSKYGTVEYLKKLGCSEF